METQHARLCPYCGKEVKGRTNKNFCSEECRNRFHNAANNHFRNIKGKVITSLSRNHLILENLLNESRHSVEISDIEPLGFKRTLVTGYEKRRNSYTKCICFDITYEQTDTRLKKINKIEI